MAKGSLAGLSQQLDDNPDALPAFKAKAIPDSAGRSAVLTPGKRGPRPPELKDAPSKRAASKTVTLYIPPEAHAVLKKLAVDKDTTMQAIFGEGIDLWMKANGEYPLNFR